MILQGVLDEMYGGKPLMIVETGTMRDTHMLSEITDGWSTLYIARWVAEHSTEGPTDCEFHSVDLNAHAIELAHAALEEEHLARFCTFHVQDSLKYLGSQTWLDFALLDSCDGLQHGVDEFRLAASAGASVIVMDDYQTKAAWAVKEARETGWKYEPCGRYSVLKRA
jgi:predicted O-methyltransferase YrrM